MDEIDIIKNESLLLKNAKQKNLFRIDLNILSLFFENMELNPIVQNFIEQNSTYSKADSYKQPNILLLSKINHMTKSVAIIKKRMEERIKISNNLEKYKHDLNLKNYPEKIPFEKYIDTFPIRLFHFKKLENQLENQKGTSISCNNVFGISRINSRGKIK